MKSLANGKVLHRLFAVCLTGLIALCAMGAAAGGPPATLQVSQVLAEGPLLVAYVAVRDEAGAAVPGIAAAQVHATVGTQTAQVEGFTPFAQTGEGVTYLFLVDCSQSIAAPRFEQLRRALRDWVAALAPQDQAALIAFGSQVRTLVAPTTDRAALSAAIDSLGPTDQQTHLHAALMHALDLGRQRLAGLPARRAIVVLSDGLDDAPGGVTADEVFAHLADGAVPIYGIGFGAIRERARREAGLAALGGFARRSGGSLVDAGNGDPAAALAAMRQRIKDVYRAGLRCAACVPDGNRYRVEIALTSGGLTLSDGMDVRLYPVGIVPQDPDALPAGSPGGAPAAPATEASRWWVYPGLALAGFLALVLVLLRIRRARSESAAVVQTPAAQAVTPVPKSEPANAPSPILSPAPAQATATRTVHLTFMHGPRRGQEVRVSLAPTALIGRDAGCALALPEDDRVSTRHARLAFQGRQVVLEDLGSTNQTFLNGVAIGDPHPLHDGDLLRIGGSEFRVHLLEHADT
ncbi:FHA domain-containing protein [uncultured Lamprocystis sp.]|jgi:Mg-chelatase subunit ChlD|uniref:FHA domain-containing protein n=1 Tax=uncultured Lamprocystis sp. TaxID=543132 RepID=UPI0025EA3850|nr:FHA domain-containing protein [uncultured Lamprocystis sp.]